MSLNAPVTSHSLFLLLGVPFTFLAFLGKLVFPQSTAHLAPPPFIEALIHARRLGLHTASQTVAHHQLISDYKLSETSSS